MRTSVGDQAFSARLRESTLRGRVMGSPAFVERLGKLVGRELHVKPAGRPPRTALRVRQPVEIGV